MFCVPALRTALLQCRRNTDITCYLVNAAGSLPEEPAESSPLTATPPDPSARSTRSRAPEEDPATTGSTLPPAGRWPSIPPGIRTQGPALSPSLCRDPGDLLYFTTKMPVVVRLQEEKPTPLRRSPLLMAGHPLEEGDPTERDPKGQRYGVRKHTAAGLPPEAFSQETGLETAAAVGTFISSKQEGPGDRCAHHLGCPE